MILTDMILQKKRLVNFKTYNRKYKKKKAHKKNLV